MKLALVIPDVHRPFHDKKAYALMMKVGADLRPDEVVLLGDYADFYSVSSHTKDPRLPSMLVDEVTDVIEGLDEIDKVFGGAQKVFIEGNHEFRLERFLCDKAPSLFGVTDTEHLLKMHSRPKWRFIPYTPHQKYQILGSKLMARHEPPGTTAKAAASKGMVNLVYGHIHRIEEAHVVSLDDTNHVSFSVGWLGNKYHRAFYYVKQHWQWQLGFGLVWVDPATKYFYHQKVQIIESGNCYTCVVNGKKYSA